MSISLQNSISLDNFNSTFHKAKKCSEIGPEKAPHQKMEAFVKTWLVAMSIKKTSANEKLNGFTCKPIASYLYHVPSMKQQIRKKLNGFIQEHFTFIFVWHQRNKKWEKSNNLHNKILLLTSYGINETTN